MVRKTYQGSTNDRRYSIQKLINAFRTVTNPKMHLLLFLSILGITDAAHAQTKFGIRAGVNFSNITEKAENGDKTDTQILPGFHFGLTADISLTGDLYLQPALLYSRKGFKQESGAFGGSATNLRVKASYIDLPVNFLYKPKLGTGHLLLGAGPYISLGTGGSWKSDTDILIGDIREQGEGTVAFRNDGSVRNNSEYTYGRPLDYGFNATLGYELRELISLQFTGMVGIANLVPHFNGYQPGGSLRNNGFGVSLGYKF